MKKSMYLVVTVACVGLAIGELRALAESQPAAGAEKAAITQSVFVCPDCHMMALKAGQCPMCKKGTTEMHVLGVKDGNAMVCSCAAACKCDMKGVKDGKCGCGKEVQKVSAKGMYVCADGCPEITDKPGKCTCGKELKKVE